MLHFHARQDTVGYLYPDDFFFISLKVLVGPFIKFLPFSLPYIFFNNCFIGNLVCMYTFSLFLPIFQVTMHQLPRVVKQENKSPNGQRI